MKKEIKRKSICAGTKNRRTFLKQILLMAAGPMIVAPSVLGKGGSVAPSERVGVGIIGFGERAESVLESFLALPDIQLRAVCDCRQSRMLLGSERINRHYGNKDCIKKEDFRELLAQPGIDAVYIAMGMRWNGMASVYSARAGKDIYCETPISLSMHEANVVREVCKRYGTIYQGGTWRRSSKVYQFVRRMIQEGRIGKLQKVEMQIWSGGAIVPETPQEVPTGWNWDMWLGQAPWRDYTPAFANGGWNYFWDTAGGMMTDIGTHYIDLMQWIAGLDYEMPIEFSGTGELPDPRLFASQTPLTGEWSCRYDNGLEGGMHQRDEFAKRSLSFTGEEGWIRVAEHTGEVLSAPESLLRLRPAAETEKESFEAHLRDFINCVRTRRHPVSDSISAVNGMRTAQAWNFALRLGRTLRWDNVGNRFKDVVANRMMYCQPRGGWSLQG